MFFVDYWWVILQLGLAAFASARGWGFTPWGLFIFGIFFSATLGSISPAHLFVAGFAWPDMLLTLILFVMVANRGEGEVAHTRTVSSTRTESPENNFEAEYGYTKSVEAKTASETPPHLKPPTTDNFLGAEQRFFGQRY